jgi:hypothetical protein|tara:strand:- start:165 stop:401 length:237 start_codon:yes stop_codon:yes gene_type:complete
MKIYWYVDQDCGHGAISCNRRKIEKDFKTYVAEFEHNSSTGINVFDVTLTRQGIKAFASRIYSIDVGAKFIDLDSDGV